MVIEWPHPVIEWPYPVFIVSDIHLRCSLHQIFGLRCYEYQWRMKNVFRLQIEILQLLCSVASQPTNQLELFWIYPVDERFLDSHGHSQAKRILWDKLKINPPLTCSIIPLSRTAVVSIIVVVLVAWQVDICAVPGLIFHFALFFGTIVC